MGDRRGRVVVNAMPFTDPVAGKTGWFTECRILGGPNHGALLLAYGHTPLTADSIQHWLTANGYVAELPAPSPTAPSAADTACG